MAKAVSKNRRAAPQDDLENPLEAFQGNTVGNQPEPQNDHTPTGDDKAPPQDQVVLGLMQQIIDMRREMDALAMSSMRGPAGPTPTNVVVPQAPPTLNMADLPNPVTEPTKYGEELAKRMLDHQNAVANYNRQQAEAATGTAQTAEQSLNALWEDFQLEYPDISEDEERLGYIAQKVVTKAKARGIDPQRYMFGNQDRFMRDVANEYKRIFGDTGEPDRQITDPNMADGRTAGVFSTPGGTGERRQAAPGPGDMIKELQERQRKSGFF